MLYVTLKLDDYIMVGDTRLRYTHNRASDSVSIEVLAPEGIRVTRDKQYEAMLTRYAEEGDARAAFLLEQLQEKQENRKQLNAIRKERHITTQESTTAG